MSIMKNVDQLFISTKRGNKYYYIAKPSDDGTSIIIQRVTREHNNSTKTTTKSYHTVATLIDYEDYVFSAIETGEMRYDVACRTPVSEFIENDDNSAANKYRQYCVECTTPQNNVLRVHLGDFNEEATVFTNFIITLEKDGTELVVAIVEVDENNELSVVLYGCPSGFEIEQYN